MIAPVDTSFLEHQEAVLVHDSIKWTIWNHDYPHFKMDFDVETKIETSFEFKFGRDLIRFVLQEYMAGLNWKPISMFVLRDLDSPFTPQFKAVTKEMLDSYGHKFHEIYDFFFPDKSKVTEIHPEICKNLKDTFLSEVLSTRNFIRFCALLSMFAGLSYHYGSILAPYQAFLELVTAVKEIKLMGQAGDDFWNVVQDWLESQEFDFKWNLKRAFWNRDSCHDRMEDDVENTVGTTFEFKFGRDLIRYVLHEYMSCLNWNPIGMFSHRDIDSPFTPQIKTVIKEVLDLCCQRLSRMDDYYFRNKSNVKEIHKRESKFFKDAFVSQAFSPERLIKFCAFLALSAGLSYAYGSISAPYESLLKFITTIRELKQLEEVDDSVWNEVQDWVERREQESEKKIDPTFWNYTNRDNIMDHHVDKPAETTFEFKFSRDLIRFVLHEYMIGLQWIPVGMFDESDLDSPFTPQFKVVIKEELDTSGHRLHEAYDAFFTDKSKVDEIHKDNCETFKASFLREMFSPKRFVKFCSLMGISAGLSFLYGSKLAPYRSFLVLVSTIQEVKSFKKVDDSFWNELQDWVECREYEIKARIRIFKLIKNFKCY